MIVIISLSKYLFMLFLEFPSMSSQFTQVYPSFKAMHPFLTMPTTISILSLYEVLLYLQLVLLHLALIYLSTKLI